VFWATGIHSWIPAFCIKYRTGYGRNDKEILDSRLRGNDKIKNSVLFYLTGDCEACPDPALDAGGRICVCHDYGLLAMTVDIQN